MTSDDSSESELGLPRERTALAWERTAIAMMVAGVLLARYAAGSLHGVLAAAGVLQTVAGAFLLVWAAAHYAELDGPIEGQTAVLHHNAMRVVGLATVAFSGCALGLLVISLTAAR